MYEDHFVRSMLTELAFKADVLHGQLKYLGGHDFGNGLTFSMGEEMASEMRRTMDFLDALKEKMVELLAERSVQAEEHSSESMEE